MLIFYFLCKIENGGLAFLNTGDFNTLKYERIFEPRITCSKFERYDATGDGLYGEHFQKSILQTNKGK